MPISSLASDLDCMLAGVGSTVSYGSNPTQTCMGSLKRVPVDELTAGGFRRIGTQVHLTIRDGALVNLVDDTPITVDGVSWTVRDIGVARQDGLRTLTLTQTVS